MAHSKLENQQKVVADTRGVCMVLGAPFRPSTLNSFSEGCHRSQALVVRNSTCTMFRGQVNLILYGKF